MNELEKRLRNIFLNSLIDNEDDSEEEIEPIDEESIELEDDLTQIGLDSFAFIRMVIMLEEEFDISIPDDQLSIDLFSSIEKIEKLITELLAH